MKTTIKELKALAKRAGAKIRNLETWNEAVLSYGEMNPLTFCWKEEADKLVVKYILLGIIAEREGLLDKPGYKEIVVQGDESTWHAGEHEL